MRASPVKAFISRTGSIAWPYLFWEFLVRTAVLPLASAFMISPPPDVGWSTRLTQALTGELAWFLWTLYVMQILLIPFARVRVWILFVASIVACLYPQDTRLGPFSSVVDHLPFLLFGAMMRPFVNDLRISKCWSPVLLSVASFCLLGLALYFGWTAQKPVWLLCGIVGSLASISLVQYMGEATERHVLGTVGVASLAIYILHPYFQRLTGEAVLRTFGTSPVWQLLLPTIVAVVGPLLVWGIAQRFGMGWLFRLTFGKNDR
jgi:peptidoglycan/LPS O-acetylase OafA/YrhL